MSDHKDAPENPKMVKTRTIVNSPDLESFRAAKKAIEGGSTFDEAVEAVDKAKGSVAIALRSMGKDANP